MEDKAIFIIQTKMEKQDYKRFLYIATFKRNIFVLPFIALISLLGSVLSLWSSDGFSPVWVFLLWLVMFCSSIAIICFKVERKNKQRLSTDNTGAIGGATTLKFYQDHLAINAVNGNATLEYSRFYQLLETKDYYIFYFNMHSASLLRKADVEDLTGFSEFISREFYGRHKKA